MICANCDTNETPETDFLCLHCRGIEEAIGDATWPESEKYRQAAIEHGAILSKFLDWLDDHNYHIATYDGWAYHETQWSHERLLQMFFGIDGEKLDLERQAMMEKLRRDNAV